MARDGQKLLHWQALRLARSGRLLFERLDGVLAAGQLLYLRGPNGSGKTSLLRILAGLGRPDEGQVFLDQEIWQPGRGVLPVCWLGHGAGLLPGLTGRQNLHLAGNLAAINTDPLPDWPAGRDDVFGITGFIDQPVRHLSQGQLRRLALSRLLAGPPQALWLLDEPDTALDTASRTALDQLLVSHCQRGGRIVITRHAPPAEFSPHQILELGGMG